MKSQTTIHPSIKNMTTTLTPVTIAGQIYTLPEALASDIEASRQRFDAMKEEDEDPEEENDESDEDEGMSFADQMKAAKAAKAKASKKDSFEAADVVDHIDSLEAENEVLAALIQQQHGDAIEDEYEDDRMDDRTPQEIAMELLAEFEEAKPFLGPEARISDYADIYDIYEDAIGTRYPGALLGDEEMDDDDDRIDPNDADELRGAFKMMCFIANPMQKSPVIAMDSKDADRAFSEALGMRSDSAQVLMTTQPKLTEYY